ncbi:TolB family protein [Cohnella abietis]|uniref:Uncharacterized protein n=1 Tax=Cohnella abietis TaxID=2507935 RepID=A0A3T1D5V2_9BACL|nr:hypothetical protein [Cohnella abietis]BBI33389.1 hypothetical protein KCTCHS21_27880 [Cohnella abietis]
MNDIQWESLMKDLKTKLPVNEELKDNLRQSFVNKRSKQQHHYRKSLISIAALILCLVLLSTLWPNDKAVPKAQAASLHFFNSFSLMEQLGKENSSGMAEYKGTIYLPMKNRGLYAYDKKGLYKLEAGNINFVRVSPSGDELVYVKDGSLYIYEISSKTSRTLLKSAASQEMLETPSWSEDGSRILYVIKKTSDGVSSKTEDGSDNSTGQISEINVKKGTIKEMTTGSYPSYISGHNAIIFENNNKIIRRSLVDGKESVLDSGQYPSVSNDGAYIAYIKMQGEPALQDIWVADSDFKTSKQVSHNMLVDAWDSDTGEPIEGKQQPRYTFEEPVWSSDSRQLFVYKVFHTNVVWKKLMQFEVSETIAPPEAIVAGSIQALIYRDEDYAHSFFSYDPGYLKGTSPRQVGYKIIKSGQQNGKEFVDADTYLSYANPFYQIVTTRYWVSKGESGYLIDGMEELNNQVVSASSESVNMSTNDEAPQPIFALKDIPQETNWVNDKIFNIVYQESKGTVFFTLNRQKGNQMRLVLLKYEVGSKQFSEIATLGEVEDSGLMIMDSEQKYVAVEVQIKGKEDTIVYDLDRHKMSMLSEEILGEKAMAVHTRFWNDGKLTFYAEMEGRDGFFQFNPESKK